MNLKNKDIINILHKRRMVKFFYQLPVVFLGVTVATFLFPPAVAKSDLEGSAKKITVKLIGPLPVPRISEGREVKIGMAGSGVIIAKENNTKTYYVLTAQHVAVAANKDKVVTSDKKEHVIKFVSKLREGIDLQILQFNSDKDYAVAELGDSDPSQLRNGANIYIAGWSEKNPESFRFVDGIVTSNSLKREDNGYTLVYKEAETENGMSGGPIINDRGGLVGIHGQSDLFYQKGIPIKTFLQIAPSEVRSALATQPSTVTVAPTRTSTPTATVIPSDQRLNTNLATINLNQTISGSLNANDPINSYTSGRFQDYQLVGVSPGQSVEINLDSSRFDPSLQIINASNNQVIYQNDDKRGRGRNSQLIFTVKSGVNYLIRVTTYYPNAIGNYTLKTRSQ